MNCCRRLHSTQDCDSCSMFSWHLKWDSAVVERWKWGPAMCSSQWLQQWSVGHIPSTETVAVLAYFRCIRDSHWNHHRQWWGGNPLSPVNPKGLPGLTGMMQCHSLEVCTQLQSVHSQGLQPSEPQTQDQSHCVDTGFHANPNPTLKVVFHINSNSATTSVCHLWEVCVRHVSVALEHIVVL